MTPEEKQFWEQNAEYTITIDRLNLSRIMGVPYNRVNRKNLRNYIYERVGIQPHEFMIQHSTHGYNRYNECFDIRVAGEELAALIKLSGAFEPMPQ